MARHSRSFNIFLGTIIGALLVAAPATAPAATSNPFRRLARSFRTVRATGHDAVTGQGREVTLSAKFEWASFLGYFAPDIRGAKARFYVDGVYVGEATTDGDGVASLPYVPTGPGKHAVTVKLVKHKWLRARAASTLFVPSRPVMVFDIDGTLSSMKEWKVPFRGAKAKAYPHAPEVLRRLAQTHDIVYLTARDDAMTPATRRFLAHHGFPEGPVLFNDLGLRTARERRQLNRRNHGKFKRRVLEGMRDRGITITAGIGNADTDGEAYEALGLPSFLRTDSGKGSRAGSTYFNDYLALERLLANAAAGNTSTKTR